jgi:outer membrane immunogenic protein
VNGGYGWDPGNSLIFFNNRRTVSAPTPGPEPAGGFGGAQAGYNWQTGRLVLGVETDFQGAAIENQFTRYPVGGATLHAKQDIDWFGTLRARAGFAVDHFLIYATGGLAYANVNDSLIIGVLPTFSALTKNQTEVGAAVGGGGEWALTANWSIKGEYQYIWLPSSGTLSGPQINSSPGNFIRGTSVHNSFQTVRAGLNYRF